MGRQLVFCGASAAEEPVVTSRSPVCGAAPPERLTFSLLKPRSFSRYKRSCRGRRHRLRVKPVNCSQVSRQFPAAGTAPSGHPPAAADLTPASSDPLQVASLLVLLLSEGRKTRFQLVFRSKKTFWHVSTQSNHEKKPPLAEIPALAAQPAAFFLLLCRDFALFAGISIPQPRTGETPRWVRMRFSRVSLSLCLSPGSAQVPRGFR